MAALACFVFGKFTSHHMHHIIITLNATFVEFNENLIRQIQIYFEAIYYNILNKSSSLSNVRNPTKVGHTSRLWTCLGYAIV